MSDAKKYRIMSIEAEKLVHSNEVGGFSALIGGKPNIRLFSGMLDYSLESEKIHDVWGRTRALSRKMYFSDDKHDYTTAVINVSFKYALHNYVMINGIYVLYGHKISDKFINCTELDVDEDGNERLMAIQLYKKLDFIPLSDELLGEYFAYDSENNYYVRKTEKDKQKAQFATLKDKKELRERLYRDGFDCDGVHYVRYKRSAGSSRSGQCLFIAEPLYKKMMKWSLCGLDISSLKEMDLASFEAYISLSLSSITSTLRIPKSSILFMKDMKSSFMTHAVSVELDGKGNLTSQEKEVEVSNIIWDGEALLDTSVFGDSGNGKKGMMLLRNRFFKTCAFNTNLQKYFADNKITKIEQLCGYTQAHSVSEIKMIVTQSSLKFLRLMGASMSFEEKICAWLSKVDDIFGIVKTDTPTGFFGGRIVRTSYQLVNTLGLSQDEVATLLCQTLDYYKNVRSSPMYMRNYINYTLNEEDDDNDGEVEYFSVRQRVMMDILSRNDDVMNTIVYKEFKKTVLGSFSKKIRGGRLLVKGTNATIFGNGLELLAASIGMFLENDAAIALGAEGQIYCKRFADGTELLGCRSPHVTMGNLLYAENVQEPLIDKYFNLSEEIVYVNAIGTNIQQRLNGCDYDSDTMLLTDNSLMVAAARRNARFSVPVCAIHSTRRAYGDTAENKAQLDYEISQNKIGEIINRSQLLNTLYWHNLLNQPEEGEKNDALYRDICILAVLSGMEIDKAKRNYDVDAQAVLDHLKGRYKMEKMPKFFNFIMEKKKTAEQKMSYDTTMDYLFSQTLKTTMSVSRKKIENKPLGSFVETVARSSGNSDLFRGSSNDARDCEHIKEYIRKGRLRIESLRAEMDRFDSEEKSQYRFMVGEIYNDAVEYVGKKLKNYHMLKLLLSDIDENFGKGEGRDQKLWWFLFETICLEKNHLFYDLLSASRAEDMYDLVISDDGTVEIYGIKHSEKMVKSAKI